MQLLTERQAKITTWCFAKLIEQGRQALEYSGACIYRADRDDKIVRCAVGQFIPDEVYTPSMEGGGIRELLHRAEVNNWELPAILTEEKELFQRLQVFHDSNENWGSSFYPALRGFLTGVEFGNYTNAEGEVEMNNQFYPLLNGASSKFIDGVDKRCAFPTWEAVDLAGDLMLWEV
jgi:hypothetical protein